VHYETDASLAPSGNCRHWATGLGGRQAAHSRPSDRRRRTPDGRACCVRPSVCPSLEWFAIEPSLFWCRIACWSAAYEVYENIPISDCSFVHHRHWSAFVDVRIAAEQPAYLYVDGVRRQIVRAINWEVTCCRILRGLTLTAVLVSVKSLVWLTFVVHILIMFSCRTCLNWTFSY